jgi:hypothetical protein
MRRPPLVVSSEDDRSWTLTCQASNSGLPPIQPTLRTGTEALLAAALAWLAP